MTTAGYHADNDTGKGGGLPWVKFWVEARTDRKLASLSDREYRIWSNLFLYAGERGDGGRVCCKVRKLAVETGAHDVEQLEAALATFAELDIVTAETIDGALCVQFINWGKRQHRKPSESREAVRDRVARSRAHRAAQEGKVEGVTPLSSIGQAAQHPRNTPVTPLEVEGELETDIALASLEAQRAGAREAAVAIESDDAPVPVPDAPDPSPVWALYEQVCAWRGVDPTQGNKGVSKACRLMLERGLTAADVIGYLGYVATWSKPPATAGCAYANNAGRIDAWIQARRPERDGQRSGSGNLTRRQQNVNAATGAIDSYMRNRQAAG